MKLASTATLLWSATFGFVAADGDADAEHNLRALKDKGTKKPESEVVIPKIYGGEEADPGEYPYFGECFRTRETTDDGDDDG